MELALGAMAGLAPKLGELLMAEYVVQKGLKPDIESLSRELVMVNAALVDASQVPPEQLTEVEKLWRRQVRELSYDMEDTVDDFILRVAGDESAADATDDKIFKKILGKATTAMKKFRDRRHISDKVRDIKKLSNELADLRAKYTVRGIKNFFGGHQKQRYFGFFGEISPKFFSLAGADLAATTGIDPRVLNLYKKESDLVGIQESRDRLIRMLSIETKDDAHAHVSNKSLKIVSIVGVGGSGKTTLAKIVHDMLKEQFVCSAFISVGRNPKLARTFEKMLVDLDEKYSQMDMSKWDDEERFCNELHKFLKHKRYFIVVDDIWDVKSWEVIRYALRNNNCGSIIIMTTRNSEVARKAREVFNLKPLSDGNSEKLFFKRIQSQGGESLDGVSCELSRNIIDKCHGIPLAIIAIASLLVDRPREDWSKVYDSIGFGNGDNTTKILSYSYYDLPSYLKPCLLHLSIFPEDQIFDTKAMIWQWIGEGFVHLEKEGSLFETGERYFNELVNRSMIQTIDNRFRRVTQWFCIHDIVFDLICKLSRDENFVTVLSSKDKHASPNSLRRQKKISVPLLDSKVRRLAVKNHHVHHMSLDMPEVLRSINILGSKIEIMAPLHSFKVCRVLYIQRSNVPINLKLIGRLLHLKQLVISETIVDELPNEIGHLKSLETLVLLEIGLDELPPAVCLLTQLMCLRVRGFKRLPADRMGNLTSLEEIRLENIVGRNATEDLVVQLGKLTRLRVVIINFSEELDESLQKDLVQSLCNLRELQELVLTSKLLNQPGSTVWEDWETPRKLRRLSIQGIVFLRLPRWIHDLPRLCFLSLGIHTVEVQDLDNLAGLPELSYLELDGLSWPPGYTVGTDGFRNMRFCRVRTTLKFHMGAMPRLEELHFGVFAGYSSWLQGDLLLEQFPTKDVTEDADLGLDNLLSLEQVTVTVDCSGATATEVQEVEGMVTRAVEKHPSRPTIKMDRVYEENILSEEEREELLQENIELHSSVLQLKEKPDASFIAYLRSYRLLEKAVISIDCAGASLCEVEKVEAAFRNAAELHHNHPTIQLIRIYTDEMVSSSDHPDTELMCRLTEGLRRFPTDEMGNLPLEELRLKSVIGRSATEVLVVELGKQTRLRVVTITFCEELEESLQKALVQSLSNLQELQELELSFTGLSQQGATVWEEHWEFSRQLQHLLIIGITFSRLPGWINRSLLPRLCFLSLDVYTVEVQDLDNLARLPELSYLTLGGSSWPPGYIVGTDGFKNLRFCDADTTLKFHMGAMPRLQELVFGVYTGYWSWATDGLPLEQFPTKDAIEDLDLGLDNLLSLGQVTVTVDCSGATAAEVQEVEAVVIRAVENHPNSPTIKMDRVLEENILSDEEREARLQHHIELHFGVLEWGDKPDALFISRLRRYRLLQKAVISIDCAGASLCEVEKVEAAFRNAAKHHRNHPTIQLIRKNTGEMVSSSDHPNTEMDVDHSDSPDNLLCKLQLGN